MPEYARETLTKMPVRTKGTEVSLTDICVKFNISKGKCHLNRAEIFRENQGKLCYQHLTASGACVQEQGRT